MSQSPQFPDYKPTVLLPKTEFPMKGNLPQKEPELLKFWSEKNIYQKLIQKNKNNKKFVLPDGPPYANGSIHIGHALNKTLKDIVIKYKNMTGHLAAFIPGWDCHGLPIEHAVLKSLGAKAKELSDTDLRTKCRAEAQKWIDHQRPQFQRLGVLADWEHPYHTMDSSYEAEQVRTFAKAYEKGYIYFGTKPVYWNSVLKTALAEAEVEYHPHKSPAIYLKFPIVDKETLKKLGNPSAPTSFMIWTTTPWTLPANLGVSLHPDFDYGVYSSGAENFIVAQKLKEAVEKETGVTLKLLSQFKGSALDKGLAHHPFLNQTSLIVNGLHVTDETGTGVVHTAPGHGADDYKVGLKYGLPPYSPIDESALYTDEYPEMKGVHIFKANPIIIEKLKSLNMLVSYKEIEHSYPHCWRSKVPLIFRATPQWFLGLDLEKNPLREKTLKQFENIKFFPEWGEARFRSMMEGRPDWCISRQRVWGVPIPIYYNEVSGEPLLDVKIMNKIADLIEQKGLENYFSTSPEDVIGKKGFRHSKDIFDVWFDSGIYHSAVMKKRPELQFPADLLLEGSDQHRGWFNTSLVSSMAVNGETPFKALITHGFVMDSQGLKMSKSKGNTVDPQEVSSKSGAEIIRLWCTYEDYGADMKCGATELDRVTETYRRIRNTMRYLLGANFDFNFETDAVPFEKMPAIDQWMLVELNKLIIKVTEGYETYTFHKVYHSLNQFVTVDLSSVYLDILKDRLYTGAAQGLNRKSSQTVIYHVTKNLMTLMAPVLSFLAEESYQHFTSPKKLESVFLENFPQINSKWAENENTKMLAQALENRPLVQKELENLRAQKTIGASLEATVEITADGEVFETLTKLNNPKGLFSPLRELLIVSEVHIKKGTFAVSAKKSETQKCVRCWIYSSDIGNGNHKGVCGKCEEALNSINFKEVV